MQYSDGMMMGPFGGMGIGMLVMLGLVFLIVVVTVALVLLLRRGIAGDPAARIRSGALRRIARPAVAAAGSPVSEPDQEAEGFLVIPDISGYTQFMQMSAFALAHAQYAVTALLTSVIEAAENVLVTAKIEGDAVFLYGLRKADGNGCGVSGLEVGEAVCALLRAFYRKRAELSRANVCRCASCRHVEQLELKVVVHSGSLLLYDLRGQRELSGLPVIAAHRLLKSDVGLKRYVLVTDTAGADVTLSLEAERRRHAQTYEGVGSLDSTVYSFTLEALLAGQTLERPGTPAKAADAARKLVEGLRGLHRAS